MTHVLLPVVLLLRRGYSAGLVWSGLVGRAAGWGHRRVAARLGVPETTVRGWLRRAGDRLEPVRVWFLRLAVTAGVDVAVPAAASGWQGMVDAVVVAARAVVQRFGVGPAVESVAVTGSGSRLLSPGWPPARINTSRP